jgi:PAS domain S-box-containing protein
MDEPDKRKQDLSEETPELPSQWTDPSHQESARNEAQWQAVIETLPAQVGMVDRNGTLLLLNRPAPGFALEQVIGTSVLDYIQPDQRTQAMQCIEYVFRTGATVVNESVVTGPSGAKSWYESRLGPVKVDNEVVAVTLVSSDVTERKLVEAGLRLSEGKYHRLYQSMMDAFVSVDMSGRIREFNDAYQRLLGYAPEEMHTLTYVDITPERWHGLEEMIVQEQVLKRGYSDIYEKEYRRKDGSLVPIELRTYLVPDESGQPVAMWAIVRDISKRKRAQQALQDANRQLEDRVRDRTEELTKANELLQAEVKQRRLAEAALRQNEAKYRALVESSPDGVGMTDLQGRILFTSKRAAEQLGLTDPDELLGTEAFQLVVEDEREAFQENSRRLVEQGLGTIHEYVFLRKDGTRFNAEISSAVIPDAKGKPVALMAVCRDITERKQNEAALRAKNAELFAAAEIQARLLPQHSPQVAGLDIAGRCYPAEAAAGDHFDFLPRPDGSLLLVMGDVSGHGIGPAIVAADFCARLRTMAESPLDLAELAVKVNSGLYDETGGEIFVTAILARLDPVTRTLSCLNAGHPPAVVLDSRGERKAFLTRGGQPFAIFPETVFVVEGPVTLSDGDLVLFYTDGLVETYGQDSSFFGIERAIQIVRERRDESAAEIVEALERAACQHAGADRPHDDITVMLLKVLPGSSDGLSNSLGPDTVQVSLVDRAEKGAAFDPAGSQNVIVEEHGVWTVARLANANYFDRDNYTRLQQRLLDLVTDRPSHTLIIDLSKLVCLSTALIGTFLHVQKRLRTAKGRLRLFGLSPNVLESLQHLKLAGGVFAIYPDEVSACREE